ncbi:MAG: 50S ribosomal protein L3 [Patescibacteria group bacterium]|nr:50S ribosomal protein L3 [Patescibacteria group bacterium]
MKFILGKKIGMSQVFIETEKDRKAIPVTLVEAGPCVVTKIKTVENDGYKSIQMGFSEKKNINKPLMGQLKELGKFRYLKEFRIENDEKEYKQGDKIDISIFEAGDKIRVVGTSKSKGFQGVMKRHNFKCGQASHGQKHSNRKPGSIGSAYPEHVIKGRKMAGRMGGEKVSQLGLEVVNIDKDNNLLLVKGSVPGNIGSLLRVVSE